MRDEFPGLRYILATRPPGHDKREGTYRGMYLTGDESLTSREWIERYVRSTGPLGALYPTKTWTAPNPHACLKEGDTPSWFFFLPLGGNDPSDPTKPGWGGQYQREPDGGYRDLPARLRSPRDREQVAARFSARLCAPSRVGASGEKIISHRFPVTYPRSAALFAFAPTVALALAGRTVSHSRKRDLRSRLPVIHVQRQEELMRVLHRA